ncbi:MAG TPA: hypothetical protein VLC95_06030, partial [Anaerolineae bacterium]|nr:hypothetical protein [Anaerolineae bacterium]
MKQNSVVSITLLLCLVLLVLPVSMAAPADYAAAGDRVVDPGSPTGPRDGSASPIHVSAPPHATTLAPAEAGVWQTGPFPPAGFQYARHDGAFVPGPVAEPWANKIYFPGGRTSPGTESPDIWMFDPLTNQYTDTGANIYEDVSNYNANLVLDDGTGRGPAIYIIGGTDKDH